MKTRISTFISIAVLPLALFSCMKPAEWTPQAPVQLKTIQAVIPGEATKVAPVDTESGTGLDWNWEEGDKISIISGDVTADYSIRPGFEAKTASFIGRQVSGGTYSIAYPVIETAADFDKVSLLDQQQKGIGDDKSHLKYYALLKDVDAYDSFSFSADWAATHGGTFRQNGVLRFCLTLPEGTTSVSRITLKADSPIFHTGFAEDALSAELSIGITEGTLGSDRSITAWMITSCFDDAIPAGTALTVNVAAGEVTWNADITPAAEKTIKSGYVNAITLDESAWSSAGRYADGEGTLDSPWIIKTPQHLLNMRDDMVSKEMRYFSLAADIDMTGVEWMPLNNIPNDEDATKAYDKYLYFDGCGHTIRNLTVGESVNYPSFAGVLYGTIKNVIFADAVITGGSNKTGVVAGYMGTSQEFIPNEISGVTVKNATVTASRHVGALVGQVATGENTITDCHVEGGTVAGAEYTGGFSGYIQQATVTACSSNAEVSGTKHVGGFVGKTDTPALNGCWYYGPTVTISATGNNQSGGFVGYAGKVNNVGATFTECYVKGSTLKMSSGQRIGGFTGQADLGTTFIKCYVEDVTIEGGQNSGGFVGVDYSNTSDLVPGGGIYQCHVDGGSITASAANCGGFAGYPEKCIIENCYSSMDVNGAGFAAIGGFLGLCKGTVTVRYCYGSGAVSGTSGPIGAFVGNVDGDANTHINSCIGWSDSLPFAGNVKAGCDVSGNYCGTEGTVSSQAAALGWDPAIWDFSAKLK